jgi:hypothetical protein
MNEQLKKIIKKIKHGDGLSDQELDQALEFFKDMETGLDLLGPTFHHAWKECYNIEIMLKGFKEARDRERQEKPRPV